MSISHNTDIDILHRSCYKDILNREANHDDDHTFQEITLAYAASNQFPEEDRIHISMLSYI